MRRCRRRRLGLAITSVAIERVHNHGRLGGVHLLGPEPPKRPQHSGGAGDSGTTDSQPPYPRRPWR